MARNRDISSLQELFDAKTVVTLNDIRECLGSVSSMTAFRYLRLVPYRRSHNHNGKLYTRHEPTRYDRHGLWSWGGAHFSIDGSLRATTRRLVYEANAGATHSELQERLQVRVQHTLLELFRKGEIERERVTEVFVYLHVDAAVRERQLEKRQEKVSLQGLQETNGGLELSADLVISVLLTLVRHPGSSAGDVVRHLCGHAPPIRLEEVEAVFTRYEFGEKGGPRSAETAPAVRPRSRMLSPV